MSKIRFIHLVLALTAIAMPGFAQTTSTVTGLITDPSHSVVPGAKIVITAIETGVEYPTKSNADGYYSVPSLPPFDYTVSATAPGFKTEKSAPFKLDSSAVARVDLVLVPSESKQTVEVAGVAPTIDTETGMVATTISSKEMADLPVQGRDALLLVATVPGFGGEMQGDEAVKSLNPSSPGAGVSIGGGRLGTTGYQVDGTNTTSGFYGRAAITLSTDSVQEMKIITNNYSAQYGSVGSGVVSMITKSGTNQIHGSAFWYNKNPAVEARTFNSVLPPDSRMNQFGVTLGGPVWIPKVYNGRHKTFFFVSVEPRRYSNVSQFLSFVPTAAERQGDLTNEFTLPGATRSIIYQEFSCVPSDASCQNLAQINRPTSTSLYQPICSGCAPGQVGHVIPQQMLDKTSQLELGFVPLPNMPYDSQGNNYLGIQGNSAIDNRWNIKFDHILSERNRLSVRYTEIPITNNNFDFTTSAFPEAFPTSISHTLQPALSFTSIVTPRIVNEVRLSYLYGSYDDTLPYGAETTNYTKSLYGLPTTATAGIPTFAIMLPTELALGVYNTNSQGITHEQQYQGSDDLTMNFGKHTMTLGVDIRRQLLNLIGSDFGYQSGVYYFGTQTTNAGNASAPGGIGGDALAAFLIGVPYQVRQATVTVPYYYRWKTYSGYFQDDYKIARNLTFNLGVRYEYESPRSEKYNRQAAVDLAHPVPVTNAAGAVTSYTLNYLYSGFGRSEYLEPTHKLGFEPRFGFAWKPELGWLSKKQFVIRGGYGWSHLPETGRSRQPIPDLGGVVTSYSNIYTQWTGTGAAPVNQAVNPAYPVRLSTNVPTLTVNPLIEQIPTNGMLCAGCSPVDPRVPTGVLYAFDQSASLPYLQSWNLTAQREMGAGIVVSMSYLGSKGTHLYSPPLDINYPNTATIAKELSQGLDPTASIPDPFGRVNTNGTPFTTTLANLARPYPTLGDIFLAGSTHSNSIYHAGTVEVERRYSRGLGIRFNYTWSKSIDDSSDSNLDGTSLGTFGATYVENPANLKQERSVSTFDARHRFNLVSNWELPVGQGKVLLTNAGPLTNAFIGGWQLNGLESLRSGYPLSVILGNTNGLPAYPSSVGLHEIVRPDIVPGVPIINPLWNKSVANTVPYINPAAFSVPTFDTVGNAPRTLDYARGPWFQSLDASIMKNFYPFENHERLIQFRVEAYNVLNHASLYASSASALFSGNPPLGLSATSLAGQVPYYPGGGSYTAGTRQAILSTYYNPNFGIIPQGQSTTGRVLQFALRLRW